MTRPAVRRMPRAAVEPPMLNAQMIDFLQATVIFLLITNAFAIAAAVCAIRLLTGAWKSRRRRGLSSAGSS